MIASWWSFLTSWARAQTAAGSEFSSCLTGGEVVGMMAGPARALEAIRVDVARRAGVPLDAFDWSYFAGRGVFRVDQLRFPAAVPVLRRLLEQRARSPIDPLPTNPYLFAEEA